MPPYRPICDVWILARPKVAFYGAYPAGFLHRARALLGVGPDEAVLHVCAGRVRDYPYAGLGPNDVTLDLDPALRPDIVHDARVPLPYFQEQNGFGQYWPAVLIDRPYTEADAAHYAPGTAAWPDVNHLVRNALGVVARGSRVGVLDYLWPQPPTFGKEVAVVAVGTGRNNRARWYTVFERIAAPNRETRRR